MTNDIIMKPSIQHFKLVAETEEKINSFINSFIKSKLITINELLAEEKIKWIFFRTYSVSLAKLPKDLADELDIYHYPDKRAYFIYPTTLNVGWYGRYYGYFIEDEDSDLYKLHKWITKFKTTNKNIILRLIKNKIIIPIRKSDYVNYRYHCVTNCYYKQEDYIRKYKINLDKFEKRYSRDIEFLKETAKTRMSCHYNTHYIINNFGQPIPVAYIGGYYKYNPKIEVDHIKGQLRIITDCFDDRCITVIDIKTNSLVKIIQDNK